MKLIICHSSALDFIRAERWRWGSLHTAQIKTLTDCASSLSEVESIRIPAFDQTRKRLEVLVSSTDKALRSEDHVCRVLKAPVIHGMFCSIAKDAYVTSPEMTFVQMATRLSFIELVLLGMELCGTYAPCPFADRFDERPPVTTKERLTSFAERAREAGVKGAATALRALRWVVNGSNSPAETALVLFLCLPVRLGGYGFKFPDMNPTTPLGKRASSMLGHPTMRCDLHWVDEAVVIEYDSDQEHLTSQSAATDARRRNVLGYKDVTVITVRVQMIAMPGAFDDVAKQLARALGRRLRPRDLEFTPARADLRIELFPWLKTGLK
jgi:hypothetical protein